MYIFQQQKIIAFTFAENKLEQQGVVPNSDTMMTSIYLERREPAHHRQRLYAIAVTPSGSASRHWCGSGVGSVRGHGAGDGVCDGRRGLGGGGAVADAEGEAWLSGCFERGYHGL